MVVCVFCSQPFSLLYSCFSKQVIDRLSSPASTVPSIDDYFEQNMWNPLLELLFFGQANGIVDSYLVEIDMAKIALSCHFALDSLCYKEGAFDSTYSSIGHHCPWSVLIWCGTIATPVTSRSLSPWYLVFSPTLRQQGISSTSGDAHAFRLV